MHLLCDATVLVTALGVIQACAGLLAVRWFTARRPHATTDTLPPVTVLKPVCGDEPMLEEAIASFCVQHYPDFQLVIGAARADDPAIEIARRLQARFPERDITVVVDPAWHGPNRKVANLMNMLPFARHDVLVFADSDLHVHPDYLVRVVTALQQKGTGLVTTLNGGEPAVGGIPAMLGATHISHSFVPGVLLSLALGRQDCLGCTMALRRETLARVGGLGALVAHVADDNVLGQLVRGLGLSVRLADTMPVVTVQESSFRSLWLHELRWARTIASLAPIGFTLSLLQFPLFWALLTVALSGGAPWSIGCFAGAWAVRAATAWAVNRRLRDRLARPPAPVPFWLLPVRDVLSAIEVIASHGNDVVVWRGHTMRVGGSRPEPAWTRARTEVAPELAKPETQPA